MIAITSTSLKKSSICQRTVCRGSECGYSTWCLGHANLQPYHPSREPLAQYTLLPSLRQPYTQHARSGNIPLLRPTMCMYGWRWVWCVDTLKIRPAVVTGMVPAYRACGEMCAGGFIFDDLMHISTGSPGLAPALTSGHS